MKKVICNGKSKALAIAFICVIIGLMFGTLPSIVNASGKFDPGDTVEVYNTGSSGLLVLDAPCGSVIGGKFDGEMGMVLDGPVYCYGYYRWKIRWSDGLEGWSAEDWLREKYIPPSTKFNIGDTVKVYNTGSSGLIVRTNPPDLVYTGMVYDGTEGTVMDGSFYGVPQGKSGFYYFWKINYGSIIGWSAQDYLMEVTKPDLTVTSVNAGPNSAEPGEYIAVSWTVKNQDGASSGSFYNRISLSTTPYGTDIFLGNYFMGSIASGSSSSDAEVPQIPPTISPGYYYVTVFADAFNAITESDENNNINYASTQIHIIPPASPATITFYTNPSNGGTITFDGTTYSNGQSTTKTDGDYYVYTNPASGYIFSHWSTTGGVSISGSWATVSGDGSITGWFETEPSGNHPPNQPYSPNPHNIGNVPLSTILSCYVSDQDGDSMDVNFYLNGQYKGTDYNVPSGGKAEAAVTGLEYDTTYYWYAVANDGEYSTSSPNWDFTTQSAPPPSQAPITSASDIINQPNPMHPDITYSVTARYYDPDGRDDLKNCYLRLKHPSKPLTMMWYQSDGSYCTWPGEECSNYLTLIDVKSLWIWGTLGTESIEGYKLTWTFKINEDWPEVENAIDFGVFASDDSDSTTGWEYDDTNADFIIPPPPTCKIKLQDNWGLEIDEINVGEEFEIRVTDYSGTIETIQFMSDENPNDIPDEGFGWVRYNWEESVPGEWDHVHKIKTWTFNSGGPKEIWARVGGPSGTGEDNADIYASFYFIHITDSHYRIDDNCKDSVKSWNDMIEHIKNLDQPPAFVIHSGDIADFGADFPHTEEKAAQNWESFTNTLYGSNSDWYLDAQHNIPIYFCPGNHDCRHYTNIIKCWIPGGSDPGQGDDFANYGEYIYHQSEQEPYSDYSKNYGDVNIVSLNSGWDALFDWGWFPPHSMGLQHIDWLRNNLEVSTCLKKIIFMHHPVYYYDSGGTITENVTEFKQACIDYDVNIVFSGHTHGQKYDSFVYYGDLIDDMTINLCNNFDVKVYTDSDIKYLVTTDSVVEDGVYRNITVGKDWMIIHPAESIYSRVTGETSCPVDLHIYDSQGNHVGLNETGGVDWEIEGAIYSKYDDHTHISVPYGNENYTFVIKGTGNGLFNFTIRKQLKGTGFITTEIQNTTIKENSTGMVYISKDSIDYTIYIDDNNDSVVDREIRPNATIANDIPYPPTKPSGRTIITPDTPYIYSTNTTDPENDQVYYKWDWGDSTTSDWLGPFDSGEACAASHIWVEDGTYTIKVRANDTHHISDWSHALTVLIDGTPPVTIKTIGSPKYGDNDKYVTSYTEFNLTAHDNVNGSGVNKTFYRIWYIGSWSPWIDYTGNFTLNGEYTHYLEFYSIDIAGNIENVANQTHFVDDSAPDINIDIGNPKYEHTKDNEYYVTSQTPIWINFTDATPNPVLYYNISYQGVWYEFTKDSNVTFTFDDFPWNGECTHGLVIWAIDQLGHTTPPITYLFHVDDSPPDINIDIGNPKYKSTKDNEYFVTSQTPLWINFTDATPNPVLYYNISYQGIWYEFTSGTNVTIYLQGNCTHTLVVWAKDQLNHATSKFAYLFRVDNIPPFVPRKEIGEPQWQGGYYISNETPITLTAQDNGIGECISGIKEIHYIINEDEYTISGSSGTFNFEGYEDGEHTLTFWSVDNLDHNSTTHTQTHIIDSNPPKSYKTFDGPTCGNIPFTPGWQLLKTYEMIGTAPETWYNDVIDLSAYAGQNITLAWRYYSDDEYLGAIDDVMILQDGTPIYSENFDSYTDDGYYTPGPFPPGWTYEAYGTSCSSPTYYRNWGAESYKKHSSPNSMACYYNCPNDDWVITPQFTLSAGSSYALDYWYFWDDSWDIYLDLYINVEFVVPEVEGPVWVTSDTEICFHSIDTASGTESLYIEVWWDSDNDGIVDTLTDQRYIVDGNPNDADLDYGEIEYCLTLPEECTHEIYYSATDYFGHVEETHFEIDHVDNSPPMVNKTFDGPGTLDYLFLNNQTLITLTATDLPEPPSETGDLARTGTITWLYHDTEGVPVTDSSDSGATMMYPGCYIYIPDHPTRDANILVYTDDWIHATPNTFVQQALTELGLVAVVHVDGDYAGFISDLNSGTWDLVIWSGENYVSDTTPADLLPYVQGGGKLIATYWRQLYVPTDPLWSEMGFTYINNYVAPPSTYWWNPSHPIFTTPESAPEWLIRVQNSGTSAGTYLEPTSSGSALAGYTTSPAANQAGIIIRNDGNTIYKGLRDVSTDIDSDTDGLMDGTELWMNMINYMLTGGGPGGGEGCASGVVKIEYRIWTVDGGWGNWTDYMGPFSFAEGCMHYLQYRAVDCLGNTLLCEDDLVEMGRETDTLLEEGFEGTLFPPSGWDQTIYNSYATFERYTGLGAAEDTCRADDGLREHKERFEPQGSYCACVWWDYYEQDEWLFNIYGLYLGDYDEADLKFYTYNYDSVSWVEHDYVEVSTDGGLTWDILADMAVDYPNHFWGSEIVLDLDDYCGWTEDIIVGFHRVTPDGGSGAWGIDHVRIEAGTGWNGNGEEPEQLPITVYNQTHYVDLEPPVSWIELELSHDGNMITPYTEFMIWQEDFACNQTYGCQCCTIHFRIDGPPESMFYWNGQYFAADGSWHVGATDFDEPVAFQIRDSTGYIKAGKYVVEFWAEDCLGNAEPIIHRQTYYPDSTAPTTTLLFSGPLYHDGFDWISEETTIVLSSEDHQGSGILAIKYQVDDGPEKTYTGPFTLSGDGLHAITYYAEDMMNHVESAQTKTVMVDGSGPDATITLTGDTYESTSVTWITGENTLEITSRDSGCGLEAIYYRSNERSWQIYQGSFTLEEGSHLLEYYGEDKLGNSGPVSRLSVGVDNQVPSITLDKPRSNRLYIAGREILTLPLTRGVDTIILGPIDIDTTASDSGCGIQSINLFIDGVKRYTSYGEILKWRWNKRTIGAHTIEIMTQDKLGYTSSKQLKIWVLNL